MANPRRRTVLRVVAATGAVLGAATAGAGAGIWIVSDRSNVGTLSFRNRLGIPPLLAPTLDSDGRKRFRLTLQAGSAEFLPGTRTGTWGVNGSYLGPTLRVRRGDRVAVDVTNRLPEATTLHWHGMHLPARMDGGPHNPIDPGTTWQPYWTVEQSAATLWYHPHLHQVTARHVYRGLAGLFVVDDSDADRLRLPNRYGVDDVPLILQDKNFTRNGSLDEANISFNGLGVTGLLGDKIIVNGTYDPWFEVTTRLVRLRVLNGSNARVYHLGFVDNREFSLIAGDSGLLGTPRRLTRLLLSPGERAEIVVPFQPGEEVVMRSFPPPLKADFVFERLAGGDDTHDLVKFVARDDLAPAAAIPATLVPQPPVAGPTGPPFRITMGDVQLNDQVMDMTRLDRVARTGSVEVWEIANGNAIPHNFHLHGGSFQVLTVDGRPPGAHLSGLKDTVYVPPGTRIRLSVRFLPYSDPRFPYMFHCHLLAHEDAGMMGQFVTVSATDEELVHSDRLHVGHGAAGSGSGE